LNYGGGNVGGDVFCEVRQSSSVLKQFQVRVHSKQVKKFDAYVIRGMTYIVRSTKLEPQSIIGERPKRLLADLVIGAHALIHADRLMTLDPARYRHDFPEFKLV
jgi:hypothetical protein